MGVRTIFIDHMTGEEIARGDFALSPAVGSIVEFADDVGARDGRVRDVRIRLSSPTLVLVYVEDTVGTIPRER